MTAEPLSLRDTARDVTVRAGLLSVGGILIGGWIVGTTMKVAGRAIHLLLLTGIALILGGFATYEVRKRVRGSESGPRALPM